MELILLTGLACVAWTSIELGMASARRKSSVHAGPHARFGAVADDGAPLDVVLDRRRKSRDRREDAFPEFSLRA
ncbi:MAG: hypothetical protein GY937_02545 [bacterium]|nr:hypothetical protein [bacterium]